MRVALPALLVSTMSAMAALAPAAAPPQSPSLDRIVASYAEARGGEKWKAVQTMKMTGRVVVRGFEAPMVIYTKRPDRSRQEMTVQGRQIVNGFDGTTAWAVNPLAPGGSGVPVTLSGPDAQLIRDQSDFDGALLDYKARGAQVTVIGREAVGDQQAYHLRITRKNLPVVHYYLDDKTWLEARIVTEAGTGQRLTVDLGKYKAFDGVMLPTSIRSLADGTLVSEIAIDAIELNVPLDDAFFRAPGKSF